MDLAGNCYLSFDTVFILREGALNPFMKRRGLRSLYSPKAERILRVLLNQPGRAWKTTELALEAGVSLGQVANVKALLADREWLYPDESGIRLSRPGELLDEWGQAYNQERSSAQQFYALAEILETEASLADFCKSKGFEYALTGFSAAARLAPMVRYTRLVAYVKGDLAAVASELGWKTVSSGANVSLLDPYDEGVFYAAAPVDEIRIVSPMQVYLDLLNSHGRGQEAAQAVRKEIEKTWPQNERTTSPKP
jgi:hypothetical protein